MDYAPISEGVAVTRVVDGLPVCVSEIASLIYGVSTKGTGNLVTYLGSCHRVPETLESKKE